MSASLAAPVRKWSSPPRDTEAPSARLVYVDWLRVLALLGVFVIHVCSVFDPWDEWHITNTERSRAIGEIIVLMAPWIMPLFMLLAGVSASYSLAHRDNHEYLRERRVRLLRPLVLGVLLLVPPQVYLERRLGGRFSGSFWAFYPHFFQGIYPEGNFSWHHLWFLGHLFVYSVVALPLFRYWQSERGRPQLRRIARICGGRAGLIWLALPLVLERHLLFWVFRERHMLTSDWSNVAILFVAYVYGFVLAAEPGLGVDIDAQWRKALVVALAATVVLVAGTWRGILPARIPDPYAPGYLVFWSLYALGAWAAMVGVLGAARGRLRRETRLLRFGRRTGFAWYVVHQPIIVAVAYLVVQWQTAVALKLAAIFVASIAGTLVVSELLARIPATRRFVGI